MNEPEAAIETTVLEAMRAALRHPVKCRTVRAGAKPLVEALKRREKVYHLNLRLPAAGLVGAANTRAAHDPLREQNIEAFKAARAAHPSLRLKTKRLCSLAHEALREQPRALQCSRKTFNKHVREYLKTEER